MEVHNALLVLTKLVSVYPSYKKLADLIEKQIEPLKTQKERKDIQALAERFIHQIKTVVRERERERRIRFQEEKQTREML
jgi:hypothetical protein